MLVLSRKKNESILIRIGGELITVMLVRISNSKVRLGISAPASAKIHRDEHSDMFPQPDTSPDSVIETNLTRLHLMTPALRQRVIAAIVQEFCGPRSSAAKPADSNKGVSSCRT